MHIFKYISYFHLALRKPFWWNLRLKKHRMQSDGNFGEFGPFLWDLWSFELERSASESPAFPYFLLLVQLKILNVHKTASKWLKKWRDRKKQNKNTRCHFYFYFFKKMEFRTYFVYFHTFSYIFKVPTNFHRVWAAWGTSCSIMLQRKWTLQKETLHLDVSIKINVKMCP